MTYRAAATYTNKSTIEIKTEFEGILEALEEIGYKQGITIGLLDFWLNGSALVNYHIYLEKLNTEKLLKENGVPTDIVSDILKDNTLDAYVLFKNACLGFIGEELTHDFKDLVLNPIDKLYTQPSRESSKKRREKLKNAQKTIKEITPNIKKAIVKLQEIEPYYITGTFEESILIKLQQIEYLVKNQIEK